MIEHSEVRDDEELVISCARWFATLLLVWSRREAICYRAEQFLDLKGFSQHAKHVFITQARKIFPRGSRQDDHALEHRRPLSAKVVDDVKTGDVPHHEVEQYHAHRF